MLFPKIRWKAFTLAVGHSFALSLLPGCGGADSVSSDLGPEAAAMAGIPAISGAVNAINQSGAVFTRDERTACTQTPAAQACSSGRKTASYTDCLINANRHKFSGTVDLSYSDASCDVLNQASTVTRTLDITRTLVLTNSTISTSLLQTTSAEHKDFRGETFKGGVVLTRNSPTTFQVEMPGIRKIRTATGQAKPLYDISIRHLDVSSLSHPAGGSLASGFKTLDRGSFEFVHNRTAFIATLKPVNLVYDRSDCCHPISGTVEITYTRRYTGTATVEFAAGLQCGLARFTRDGTTKDLELHGCE